MYCDTVVGRSADPDQPTERLKLPAESWRTVSGCSWPGQGGGYARTHEQYSHDCFPLGASTFDNTSSWEDACSQILSFRKFAAGLLPCYPFFVGPADQATRETPSSTPGSTENNGEALPPLPYKVVLGEDTRAQWRGTCKDDFLYETSTTTGLELVCSKNEILFRPVKT